jgi:hypothetical protein
MSDKTKIVFHTMFWCDDCMTSHHESIGCPKEPVRKKINQIKERIRIIRECLEGEILSHTYYNSLIETLEIITEIIEHKERDRTTL